MSSPSAYERKLAEMREYVPFLRRMIDKLERAGDRSKDTQLAKMKSLRQGRDSQIFPLFHSLPFAYRCD